MGSVVSPRRPVALLLGAPVSPPAAKGVIPSTSRRCGETGCSSREQAADDYGEDKCTWLKWARKVAILGGALGFVNVVAVVFSIYKGWVDGASSAILVFVPHEAALDVGKPETAVFLRVIEELDDPPDWLLPLFHRRLLS